MSTYQFFIIVHGLREVLVWLVPLLVAILLCVTALVISARWIRERRSASGRVAHLSDRIEALALRIEALERLKGASRGDRSLEGESGAGRPKRRS